MALLKKAWTYFFKKSLRYSIRITPKGKMFHFEAFDGDKKVHGAWFDNQHNETIYSYEKAMREQHGLVDRKDRDNE